MSLDSETVQIMWRLQDKGWLVVPCSKSDAVTGAPREIINAFQSGDRISKEAETLLQAARMVEATIERVFGYADVEGLPRCTYRRKTSCPFHHEGSCIGDSDSELKKGVPDFTVGLCRFRDETVCSARSREG